jgi:hypothetical protein
MFSSPFLPPERTARSDFLFSNKIMTAIESRSVGILYRSSSHLNWSEFRKGRGCVTRLVINVRHNYVLCALAGSCWAIGKHKKSAKKENKNKTNVWDYPSPPLYTHTYILWEQIRYTIVDGSGSSW